MMMMMMMAVVAVMVQMFFYKGFRDRMRICATVWASRKPAMLCCFDLRGTRLLRSTQERGTRSSWIPTLTEHLPPLDGIAHGTISFCTPTVPHRRVLGMPAVVRARADVAVWSGYEDRVLERPATGTEKEQDSYALLITIAASDTDAQRSA